MTPLTWFLLAVIFGILSGGSLAFKFVGGLAQGFISGASRGMLPPPKEGFPWFSLLTGLICLGFLVTAVVSWVT